MTANHDLRRELDAILRDTADGANLDPIFRDFGVVAQPGIGPRDFKGLVHAGQLWWEIKEPEVRSLVCRNQVVKRFARDEDLRTVCEQIAELLLGIFGVGTAAKMAVVIGSKGLKVWCKDEWNNDGT